MKHPITKETAFFDDLSWYRAVSDWDWWYDTYTKEKLLAYGFIEKQEEGNIELRETKNIVTWKKYKEIVCWYDNPRYKEDYSQYEVVNGMVKIQDGCYRSLSLYETKKLCLTIAIITDNWSIEMTWDRYLYLNEKDKKDFDKIWKEIVLQSD